MLDDDVPHGITGILRGIQCQSTAAGHLSVAAAPEVPRHTTLTSRAWFCTKPRAA